MTPLWMGPEAYHSVLAHMIRRGFATREILKSQMEFRVRNPFEAGTGSDPTSSLLDKTMEETVNMCCDLHVFQRMRVV
jgi:hypothetical protein